MKLNRIHLIPLLAGLMFAGGTALAESPKNNVQISNIETTVTDDNSLQLQMQVVADNLHIRSLEWLRLEFSIDGKDQKVYLPEVIYTGGQRYRFERRRRQLSGIFAPLPSKVYKKVKSDETYTLNYTYKIPYQDWMNEASLNYRKMLFGCKEDYAADGGQLLAEVVQTPPVVVRTPNPEYFATMVSFLQPVVEEVKARAASVALNIDYPRGVYEIRPQYGRNALELHKVDTLMTSITNNDLITIRNMNITGYASPEGTYKANDLLSRRRSEGFRNYMVSRYNLKGTPVKTAWVAEDWDLLKRMLDASDFPRKEELIALIDDPANSPDAKERILRQLDGGKVFTRLLEEYFPSLRRIELKADYEVAKVSTERARELIYTRPELLSQDEMMRVASTYSPGSDEYKEVYRIVARNFPSDVVANNNAAAAFLQEGDIRSAEPYLEKIKSDPRSFVNLGVYHYIQGEFEQAENYFRLAQQAGESLGQTNLDLISK